MNQRKDIPLDELSRVIHEAGDLMRRVPDEVREHPAVKEGSANFVTEYDVRVQDFLKSRLSVLFPEASFFAEEDGKNQADLSEGDVFIIDPIDGTTNFMCGYPVSAVSVALMRDGKPLYGGIYHPYRDEYVSAVRGAGAFCNGQPIHVSCRPPERALICIGTAPYRKDRFARTVAELTYDLLMSSADVRRSGSAAIDLCSVAMGRADAFLEPVLCPWDYAAGYLILTEAGGNGTDFSGRPIRFSSPSSCVFASPAMGDTVRRIAARYAKQVDAPDGRDG